MKRVICCILSVVLVMLSVATTSATVNYTDHNGNYNGTYKVDPPASTTVYFDASGKVVTSGTDNYIKFTVSADGRYLSFVAVNVSVSSVYLKGGNNYRIYTWKPSVSEAADLSCPLNGGGNIPKISHYGFDSVLVSKPSPTKPIPVVSPTPRISPIPKPTVTPTVEPTTSPTPTKAITPTPTVPVRLTPTEKPVPTVTSYNPETGYAEDHPWFIFVVLCLVCLAVIILLKKNIRII